MRNEAGAATSVNLTDIEARIQTALTLWKSVEKLVQDHKDALQYMAASKKRELRKEYLHDRFQLQKYAGYMTLAGWPKLLAKYMGGKVHKFGFITDQDIVYCDTEGIVMNTNMTDFQKLQVWQAAGESHILKEFLDAAGSAETAIKAKRATGELAMRDNKKWAGCLQCVDLEGMGVEFPKLKESTELLPNLPTILFVATARRWNYRFGPAALPLPGAPCFMSPLGGQWLVAVFPLNCLLTEGIVVNNFDAFVKTPAGVTFMEKHAVCIRLDPGHVAYIPGGHVCLQVLVHDLRNESACGHMLVHVVASAPLIKAVDDKVWSAMYKCSNDHIQANMKQVVFKTANLFLQPMNTALADA